MHPFLPVNCSWETGRCHPRRPTSPGRTAVEFCPGRHAGPRVPPARGAWGGDSALTSSSWTPCPTPLQRREAPGLSQPWPAGCLPAQGCSFPAVGSYLLTPVCAAALLGRWSCWDGSWGPGGVDPNCLAPPDSWGWARCPLSTLEALAAVCFHQRNAGNFSRSKFWCFPSVWE